MQRLAWIVLALAAAASARASESVPCATHPDLGRWLVSLNTQGESPRVSRHAARADDVETVGHVAVMRDHGDILVRKNPFDLDGRALRLTPVGDGFTVLPLEIRDPGPAGDTLRDIATAPQAVALPFGFPFFGRTYQEMLVHADGLIVFGDARETTTDRSLPRFLEGPPAIAAFYADLSPERGGAVTLHATAGALTVAWTDVPGGSQINRNTFEVTLRPDGVIELSHRRMETREGLVGVTPGAALGHPPRDLSAGATRTNGAIVESFSETERLDLVSALRRFYRVLPDVFDQVVVYTTRPLNPLGGSFAFEVNVSNEVEGIGLGPLDSSAAWGSAGRLASVVYMDSLEPYRDVDGMEILGHEVSHRWLARLRFRDRQGALSDRLLAGDRIHWSFFLDSDASMIGGNEIAETAPGQFETTDFARGYSALDQYAMGLRSPEEVPPFFVVEGADRFRPNRTYKSSSSPEAGVRFTGRRTTVTIGDVIAALGPRLPSSAQAPRMLRQAYVLVTDEEAPPTPDRIAVVERIRSRFERFFEEATGGRGRVDADLPVTASKNRPAVVYDLTRCQPAVPANP